MTITLPKNVEEKLASLPQEEIEGVLLRLAEQRGHDKEKDLGDALQKGLDDIEAGRVTSASTKEEREALFRASRERVLEQARRQ